MPTNRRHPESGRFQAPGLSLPERYPISALLPDIRSLYNVGAIFRTADACLFDALYLAGYTGCPPRKEIHKTALGAEETVPWKHYKSALRCARMLKKQGISLVAVETSESAIPYTDFKPTFPVCCMFGNEVDGLHPKLLELADHVVSLPMRGLKNSLNVSVAFGIVAYHVANTWERLQKNR